MTDPGPENLKSVDAGTLVALAGRAAFQRGEIYYLEARVGDLHRRDNQVTATVTGNEEYRVVLTHTARVFEGVCDCPASEGFDFCKHCVAAALKYIQQSSKQEKLNSGSDADLLQNYLHQLDRNTLVSELLALIEYDPELEEKWRLRAELAAGKMDFRTFKKRITRAIPYNRNLYRYAQVRRYFGKVETLIDTARQLFADFDPEQSLELIDYALSRIGRALETVDDSGGFRLHSVGQLGEMHIRALADCDWPPEKVADYLRELYLAESDDLYPDIPDDYLHILGDQGLDLFNTPLREEWNQLPDLEADYDGMNDWKTRYHYHRLQSPLLAAARIRNDLDAEIALLAKTASSPRQLIDISRLCLEHERVQQAIEWWRKARARAALNPRDRSESALLELELQILVYQKDYARALTVLWSGFQNNPLLGSYRQLLELARLAGDERDFYRLAITALNPKSGEPGQHARDLICEIHLEQKNPEAALQFALKHPPCAEVLLDVIRANSRQAEKILPLYVRLAESEIQLTNNSAYRNGIKLLKEAERVSRETLQDKLTGEIARLRRQYKAKRNFVKWLDEAFPEASAG